MRLAIADPPYLGRSHWYTNGGRRTGFRVGGTMNVAADHHPDATHWDDPQAHVDLVAKLAAWDGWAIAMSRDSLLTYLQAAPDAHVCVWHNPAAWPPGGRIHPTWEPVLVRVPDARRTPRPVNRKPSAVMTQRERDAITEPSRPKDVLIATAPRRRNFIGAKPPQWTRWVLDMLGYDPETDTVDDLFHGSGAVAAEIAQGVLL